MLKVELVRDEPVVGPARAGDSSSIDARGNLLVNDLTSAPSMRPARGVNSRTRQTSPSSGSQSLSRSSPIPTCGSSHGARTLPFCCHAARRVAHPESKRPACAGPLPLELAGLEPATSWVRYGREPLRLVASSRSQAESGSPTGRFNCAWLCPPVDIAVDIGSAAIGTGVAHGSTSWVRGHELGTRTCEQRGDAGAGVELPARSDASHARCSGLPERRAPIRAAVAALSDVPSVDEGPAMKDAFPVADDYPLWKYYPSRARPPDWVAPIIAAFAASRTDLDTASVRSTSDAALAVLRPALIALGFDVEAGKKKTEKIRRPVLFGEQGKESRRMRLTGSNRQMASRWRSRLDEVRAGTRSIGISSRRHSSWMHVSWCWLSRPPTATSQAVVM